MRSLQRLQRLILQDEMNERLLRIATIVCSGPSYLAQQQDVIAASCGIEDGDLEYILLLRSSLWVSDSLRGSDGLKGSDGKAGSL